MGCCSNLGCRTEEGGTSIKFENNFHGYLYRKYRISLADIRGLLNLLRIRTCYVVNRGRQIVLNNAIQSTVKVGFILEPRQIMGFYNRTFRIFKALNSKLHVNLCETTNTIE